MTERLNYHFEPKTGWINDPNGLIYFRGQYHAFFQYYPHAPKPGQMHWGHAVSNNLITWEEIPIALYPDRPYENSGGCWSGSAIEKDGKLYLFYTSVSHELGQTQSVAVSEDGIHFEKYEKNPVIVQYPPDGSGDFRDPKVTKINDTYYMVCGSSKDKIGKIVMYESGDLLNWTYNGVLYENAAFGTMFECPDFFPLDDKFVLMFSKVGLKTYATQFVVGQFDGKTFTPESFCTPEMGPQFYAPQTLSDPQGRRIMIAWLYDWGKKPDDSVDYAGALTIPRELRLQDNQIINYPVAQAHALLKDSDELVTVTRNCVIVKMPEIDSTIKCHEKVNSLAILKDTKTIEIFINEGKTSISCWFKK